jgi:hypothetical protein
MVRSGIMYERLGLADCFCVPSSLHLCCTCAESTAADNKCVCTSCPWPVRSGAACTGYECVIGAKQGLGTCVVFNTSGRGYG